MELGKRISVALQIRSEERSSIAILLGVSFLLGLAYVLADTAASTLLIANFDTSILPILYIAIALAVPIAGAIYASLAERYSFQQLTLGSILFLLVSVVTLAIPLTILGLKWPILVYFVWVEVFYVLLGLAFWGMAGRMFTLRQGKRLFGIITTGEVVAMVLMGAIVIPLLVKTIAVESLLLLQAGVLCLLFIAVTLIWRYAHVRLMYQEEEEEEAQGSFKELLRNRYIALLLLVSALSIMSFYVLDNTFYTSVSSQLIEEEQLVIFFSRFFALTAAFTLLSNLLLSARMLSRFGLRLSLLVLPALLLIGAILAVVSGLIPAPLSLVFWIIVTMRAIDEVGRYSIAETATRVIYQPLPLRQRAQTQAVAEGIAMPVAIGLAGVGLGVLVLGLGISVWHLTLVMTAVLITWTLAANSLGREYLPALVQASARRILGEHESLIMDKTALGVIQNRLTSDHPGEIVHALDLIQKSDSDISVPTAQRLLAHADAAVRYAILDVLAFKRDERSLPLIRNQLTFETDTVVLARALTALIEIGQDDTILDILPYLSNPNAVLRRKALASLLNFGGKSCEQTVHQHLKTLSSSPDAQERMIAAQALYDAGEDAPLGLIIDLVKDSRPEIREVALRAAGQSHNPSLVPLLIQNLAAPRFRASAHFALVDMGNIAVSRLHAFLNHPDDQGLHEVIALTLAKIATDESIAILLLAIASDDRNARKAAFSALRKSEHHGHPTAVAHASQIVETLGDTLVEIAWKRDVLDDLTPEPTMQPLRRALAREIQQGLSDCLNVLAIISSGEMMRRARRNLYHPAAEQRAYAVEIIETLLPHSLKPHIVLFEAAALAETAGHGEQHLLEPSISSDRCLEDLLDKRTELVSNWTLACALYAMAGRNMISPDVGRKALVHPAPIVRETAAWALKTRRNQHHRGGQDSMLIIEKVIILRTAAIFAQTPDEILAAVAQVTEEVRYRAGARIISKGDYGSSMFVIVDGDVIVHDGDQILAELGERDIVGEMALLDSEPRSASVTARSDALLLRIDQDAFYELMDERIDVMRGVLRVLVHRLREANVRAISRDQMHV